MNRRCFKALICLLSLTVFAEFAAASDRLTDATVVVYNKADPLSEDLALYYARKRGIAENQVIGLTCPTVEEISREQYDQTIAEPLRAIFVKRGWWKLTDTSPPTLAATHIRCVALIRGIPLKITGTPSYPGDQQIGPPALSTRNEAAVDSELAVLGLLTRQISSALHNPYYRSYTRFVESRIAQVMLVCRLDAPSGDQVKRMIDDSIAAEKNGVWGFAYIDLRNAADPTLAEGDGWLRETGRLAETHGIPVVMGRGSELFPAAYPMENAAFYFGWYSAQVQGPFVRPDFRFSRGAIAAHIHSFSAATLRSPGSNWVGPLIAAGAAASFGNVYEPYLGMTTQPNILFDRLLGGFTFAESAYAATSVLSWMSTFVGDPLYRPFKVFQDLSIDLPKDATDWIEYRSGALAWANQGRTAGEERLIRAGEKLRSGMIFEGLASLQAEAHDADAALKSSRIARRYYKNTADIIRAAYREANLLTAMNRKSDALTLLRRYIREYERFPVSKALVQLRDELDPPPPPPPPPTPPSAQAGSKPS